MIFKMGVFESFTAGYRLTMYIAAKASRNTPVMTTKAVTVMTG